MEQQEKRHKTSKWVPVVLLQNGKKTRNTCTCMCTPNIPAGRPNNGDAAVLLLYTCTIDRKNKNDTYGTGIYI